LYFGPQPVGFKVVALESVYVHDYALDRGAMRGSHNNISQKSGARRVVALCLEQSEFLMCHAAVAGEERIDE
jgi:hypothetical protein